MRLKKCVASMFLPSFNIDLLASLRAHLSDVLKHGNYKLAMLYHSNNRLIYVGAAHLIDALKHGNCKLAVLYLSDNRLTDSRAAHLRDALI